MTTVDNEKERAFWNGAGGETWVRAQAQLDQMLAPLLDALLAGAALQPGRRVLDLGCGCGASSLAAAESGAEVVGLDFSAPMISLAEARGNAASARALRFICEDATKAVFPTPFDHLISRFGGMFFADPVAAYAKLRGALVPGGRLTMLVWQAPKHNPWMSVVGQAVAPFLPPPSGGAPDPRAPGPFAFADPAYVTGLLEAAGWESISLSPVERPLHLADTMEEALALQSQVGPLARVLRELEETAREAALTAAREALAPHFTPEGLVLGAACHLVEARAP
ncbi:MAG: class I SAM-dependent methyltransferase [Pseudomonadales bacterium]